MLRRIAFVGLLGASLSPWVTAPLALSAGLAFALTVGNPFPAQSKRWQTLLLQGSVIGLGAGMNLLVVVKVGAAGLVQTFLGLVLTLGAALLLAKVLSTEPTTSLLIGVGTAICGGSAIAAVAPAIGAKGHQSSLALAVVFVLNAVALVAFPRLGHALLLTPEQFGWWSALAIHDTSSVVGAALQFGPGALGIATTVKLARALWIFPVTLVLARVWKRERSDDTAPAKWPVFILGFLGTAALVTFVPAFAPAGHVVAAVARQLLVATLFLVGAQISRDTLRQTGARPLLLGLLLWAISAGASLTAIRAGLVGEQPSRSESLVGEMKEHPGWAG